MRSLKVIGKAFVDVYDNMFVLLLCNIVYVILAALPITFLATTVQTTVSEPATAMAGAVIAGIMALLWVLLAGPAGYALAVMLRRVTEYQSFTVRDFFGAIREHYRRAWLLGLVSLVITALLLINLIFYATPGILGGFGPVLVPLFVIIAVFWLLMQMYIYPLGVITEGGPLRVLRNAAIVVVRHPGLTLLTGLVSLIVAVASSVLVVPWVIISVGALTALGTRAVRSAVRRDFSLPEEDPLVDEPLPPIGGDEAGDRKSLPHYGWRAGRREAGDEEPAPVQRDGNTSTEA